MFQRDGMTRLGRPSTRTVDSAIFAAPSWGATPEPAADSGVSRAPAAGFDFGSLSIFPPEPQVGPEGGELGPATAGRIRAKQGDGASLESPVQRRMEGAFGHTFADVRVHADGESDMLSRSLSARAFTLGSDIFLGQEATGAGPYGGDALMAHELTHVVQQSGMGRGGPVTVDPVDAPAEREASAVAQDVSAGSAVTGQMQQVMGNHAVLQRVASAPDAPAAPADLAAQSAFNVMDINHKLLRAIDQSHVTIVGSESHALGLYSEPILKRHVDVAETVAALNHLTAAQVEEVKSAYLAHEKRTLETDLFGPGGSGYPTDLTGDQSDQIRALLGGTKAEDGASDEEHKAAATHDASAKAAELHTLLKGDLERDDIEHVMGILRQDATANGLLMAAYGRLGEGQDLRRDTMRMGALEGQRAWKLLDGDIVGADAFKVGLERARIEGINAKIMELLEEAKHSFNGMAMLAEIQDLGKERKKLIEDIEQRAAQAGTDARAETKGDAHAAVQARVAAVLGDAGALATVVGGADAAVINAAAEDDPVDKVAAQLHKSAQDGKLDAEQLTAALRGLRAEAAEQAQRSLPMLRKDDPRVKEAEQHLADGYFGRLRSAYNSLIGSGDDSKRFDDLINDTGNEGDANLNISLVREHGKLEDVAELVLALHGDRKDTAAVERVLQDKSAEEIKQLKTAYTMRTGGRSLDFDLFGDAATTAGVETEEIAGIQVKPGTMQPIIQGKASGTSRLNLEDYMQRPDTEGGPQEASYILARAEREYQYTIDNRGATGWWRDHWGNEERQLLDETMEEVRSLFGQYCLTVGWIPAFDPAGANLQRPQMVPDTQATAIIAQMRLARATIRGDRAAYEKATAELRAMFEMVAAFVIQAVLTALLTPAAGALFGVVEAGADAAEAVEAVEAVADIAEAGAEVTEGAGVTARVAKLASSLSVNVASTVGSNIAVHGSNYSLANLKEDLLGGLGGELGGAALEKMLGPVANGLAKHLGPKASAEIVAFGKTAGSIQGGAWAQGSAGDISIRNLLKTHLMGKAAGAITHATGKVTGLTPEPGPQKAATPEGQNTPQTAEPTPQENGSGGSGGGGGTPSPSSGVPSGGNGGHGTVIHSIPSADGVAEHDLRTTSDAEIDRFVHGMDPDASSPHYQGSVRSDTYFELPAGQDQPGMVPVPLPPGTQGPVQMAPGMVPSPAGLQSVDFTYGNPNNANAIQYHENMGFRGVAQARIANQSDVFPTQTNEAGQPTTAAGEYTVPNARGVQTGAPGQANTTGSVIPDATPNAVVSQVPVSPTNSPYAGQPLPVEVRAHSENLGLRQPMLPLPEGVSGPLRANPNYNPDAYSANNPTAQVNTGRGTPHYLLPDGTWITIAAATPQQRADAHWPIGGTNLPPGAVPPGNGGGGAPPCGGPGPGPAGGGAGGPRTPFFTAEEVAAAIEGIRPAEEGGIATSGAMTRGPGDEMTEQTMETVSTLSQRNDEVRQLVRGEGTAPLPQSDEDIGRSNVEVQRAQQVLQDPNATPEDQINAIRALAERAVAEYRTTQQMGTKDSGEPYGLTADDLRGMCGAGRDISAEAIIALVGASPHEIRIERIQAAHLGIGARHGFLVVTLADGTRFLVDPTFAQFADQIGGKTYTAEPMLSSVEGSTLARDLLRDGMVPLTDEAVRQYVIGLGADAATADAATVRLMSGGATLLTEIVRNGQVERFPGRPEEAYNNVSTVSDPAVSPLTALTNVLAHMPAGDPRRPLLESLETRFTALAMSLPRLPEPPD